MYPVGSIIQFYAKKTSTLAILANKIFTPHTHLYHAAIIGHYIPEEDDYEIMESIGRGISLGRLSFYNKNEYVVYYPSNINLSVGEELWIKASKYGRIGYDYKFYPILLLNIINIEFNNLKKYHKFKAISPTELNIHPDHEMVCTRFAKVFWNQYNKSTPYPYRWCSIPASYPLAVTKGHLTIIGKHTKNTLIYEGYIK